ncbi:hypothetical protein K439DRAFT_1142608 [Ramaria rubella]|nr:hypothetical protein K439DRAFT_1142608 [Ramaria rubella]
MIFFLLFSLSRLAIPVVACEGQCIVDVTNAFIGNYTKPMNQVFADAADKISKLILPSENSVSVLKLMSPVRNAYSQDAYFTMETAIFPSYFHGKCQVNGIDPAGCPNPDCPVVCGTPGSLVHFYDELKTIAYNATSINLANITRSSSNTYRAVEAAVINELRGGARSRRSLRSVSGVSRPKELGTKPAASIVKNLQKRGAMSDDQAKVILRKIFQDMEKDLAKSCGEKPGLPDCSWEHKMKTFILSFP